MPVVGVYIHLWHTYGQDILRGISKFAAERGDWECYLPWPGSKAEPQLPDAPLDGVILRVGGTFDAPFDFAAAHPRVVIANTDEVSASVDVSWDNPGIGRRAGEHLLEQGHRHVLVVGQLGRWVYERQRAEGLWAALAGRGVHVESVDLDFVDRPALQTLLTRLPTPAAVFATTDPVGSDVLRLARAAGRRVPDELAVVAAGDNEVYCEMTTPPLSSVALPGIEVGYKAAASLHRLLSDGARAAPCVVPSRFVMVRRSSDALAIDDELVVRVLRAIRADPGAVRIARLRALVPLSRRALEIRFKRSVGRTIEQELQRARLERAKRLLLQTSHPIAAIADRAGFSSAQRLSTVFARHVGVSPSAYRRLAESSRRSERP